MSGSSDLDTISYYRNYNNIATRLQQGCNLVAIKMEEINMVRMTENIVVTSDGKRQIAAFGLSTDNKPTENIVTGSVFFEIDTTDVYFFDEDSGDWLKAGAS